jgi:hypothetical protein
MYFINENIEWQISFSRSVSVYNLVPSRNLPIYQGFFFKKINLGAPDLHSQHVNRTN